MNHIPSRFVKYLSYSGLDGFDDVGIAPSGILDE